MPDWETLEIELGERVVSHMRTEHLLPQAIDTSQTFLILPDDPKEWRDWIDKAATPGERKIRKEMVFAHVYGKTSPNLIPTHWDQSVKTTVVGDLYRAQTIINSLSGQWVDIGSVDSDTVVFRYDA